MTDNPKTHIKPPARLKEMNEELMQQQRLDTLPFDLPVLTVPGRRSGQPRRTPLTVLERDGERYVLGGFPAADWIRNVRAAGGRGTLSTSGVDEPVRLVELTADDARPVLRAWPAAGSARGGDDAGRRRHQRGHLAGVRGSGRDLPGVPRRRSRMTGFITVTGARENNLHNVSVRVPKRDDHRVHRSVAGSG